MAEEKTDSRVANNSFTANMLGINIADIDELRTQKDHQPNEYLVFLEHRIKLGA